MLVELYLVWFMLIIEPFSFEAKPPRNTGGNKIHVSLFFFFNLDFLYGLQREEKRY